MRAKTAPARSHTLPTHLHRHGEVCRLNSDRPGVRVRKRHRPRMFRLLAVIPNAEAFPGMNLMRLSTSQALGMVLAQLLLDHAPSPLLLRPRKTSRVNQKPLPADATTNVAVLVRQLTNHLVQVHLS